MNKTELVPAYLVAIDGRGKLVATDTESWTDFLSTATEAAAALRQGKAALVAGDDETLRALAAELERGEG